MNIALVFPPSTFLSAPMTWPPLGLWYIAAQLEAQGHTTEFFDLSEDALPKDGEFHQMWISATAPQMAAVREIGEATKDWWYTYTILGGPAVWANPTGYRDLPFDLLVAGEGDHPQTVAGITDILSDVWEDQVYFAPISKTLDWVLPPVRRWSHRYKAELTDRLGNTHRMTTIFTARGCPMSCAFCESGRNGVIWDNQVRYEPLWSVEHQLKEIVDLGFDGLTYYDDIFILNKRRTLQILDMHKKYKLFWRCFLRSDILHKHGGKDYLKAMKDAGLIEIFVGVESADNRIKTNIHKGTTIEQDEAVLQWCKELDITCKMSFILGLPGEDMQSMNRTRDWILRTRPHIVQVDRLIPFPGVPLTKNKDEYDLKYDAVPDEEWFFRGRHDINSRSFVSTSSLSRDEIDFFWHNLEQELIAEGLSGYKH